MDEMTEIEQNVTELVYNGRRILLIGTAHVSLASADLVERTIRDQKPDTVCLELCEPRYQNLLHPDRWREMDIVSVIRSGKLLVLMAQLVLSSFQKRLANKMGIKPGEEMHRAIAVANELNIPLGLVDREVRITLRRTWARAGLWNSVSMLASLLTASFSSEEISEEDIEKLKQGDALAALMQEFSKALPGVKEALIDERDRYMSQKIKEAPGQVVIAVVGAGHIPGLKKCFPLEIDLAPLEQIPPPSLLAKSLGWGLPLLIFLLVAKASYSSGIVHGLKMLGMWALVNGLGSAIFTALCFAHPLTILAAFLSSPVAAIHPFIGVGWVCALVEAMMRRPRVLDFEHVSDAISSVSGFWQNRVTRLFLVLVMSSLGSIVATIGWAAVTFYLKG